MTTIRRVLLVVLVPLLLLAFGGAPADASSTSARVIGEDWRTDRMVDLTIDSPAVDEVVRVRLLVPRGWTPDPHRSWPVLYLLHGCCDDYKSWTRSTDVEQLTSDTDALVVMPEAGEVGFYSNWWNGGAYGPPAWETFHLTELRQILERHYGAGHRRAIAGLSMGGFGALSYAARYPMLFRAAASYSGVVDPSNDPDMVRGLLSSYDEDPLALWGDPERQAEIWAAHNPVDLANRLHGRRLYVSSGDGRPGPFDDPNQPVDELERALFGQSKNFVDRAEQLGLKLTTNLYGPGTHSWPYWERELHASFPMLMRSIGADR